MSPRKIDEKPTDPNPGEKDLPADPETTEIARAAFEGQQAPKVRLCPHCKGELIKHGDESPFKAGAYHCDSCGACWAPGLRHMREGHPPPVGFAG